MSGALARLGRLKFPFAKLPARGVFNASGSAGPRRLMVFVLAFLGLVALVVVVATTGTQAPVPSKDARMKRVDPLPGGLYSTPEQDALAIKAYLFSLPPVNAQTPENIVHGLPLYYATSLPRPGGCFPVLVESHEGRPTKIEGNPNHPASLGATDLFNQASVLTLYDPDRSKTVTHLGQTRTMATCFQCCPEHATRLTVAS